MRATIGARLILLGITLAVSLASVEAVLRWLETREVDRAYQDVELGWVSPEYRDFDPNESPRKPGERRILFLGDSMIVEPPESRRKGVPGAGRLPAQLERLLGPGTVVRALARSGWGTDQELMAFMQKGLAFEPDVVVLAFCAYNDLSNNLSNRLGSRSPRFRKPYFVLEDEELVLYDDRGEWIGEIGEQHRSVFRSRILEHLSRLTLGLDGEARASRESPAVDARYQLFKQVERPYREVTGLAPRLSWAPQATVDHLSAFIHEDFALNGYQWRLFDALMGELSRQVAAIDARLVVLLLPVPIPTFDYDLRFVTGSGFEHVFDTPSGSFTLRTSEPGDRLAEIAARHHFELFDPSAEFLEQISERGLGEASWLGGDTHFVGPSHRMLAELLYSYLQGVGPEAASQRID